MIAKATKRPLWGIDPYLHFIVLGLSVLNIITFDLNLPVFRINDLLSVTLSAIGIFGFILAFKGYSKSNLLFLIWSIPQIIQIKSVSISPIKHFFEFDVSQGFSLPITFSTSSTINNFATNLNSFGINVIGICLLLIVIFKLKNKAIGKRLKIKSLNHVEQVELEATVLKEYILNNHKLIILDYAKNGKNYVVQTSINDKIELWNEEKNFYLCEVDSNLIGNQEIKSSSFRKLFADRKSVCRERGFD